MNLEDMMDIVANYVRNLDTTPLVLAYSLAKLKEAYKLITENPQITKEEYLKELEIEEE